MLAHSAEYFVTVLAGLFPIANPFSTAPILVGLTKDMEPVQKRRLIRNACVYMAAILLIFLFGGGVILDFFSITIPGLRIAGGLVIGYIGFGMLFPKDSAGSSIHPPNTDNGTSLALTPLAMPMLSGPGSIAVVVSLAAEIAPETEMTRIALGYASVAAAVICTALICWVVLRAADWFTRFLGPSGIDAMTRIMGFLLICVAVQFLAQGIKQIVAH